MNPSASLAQEPSLVNTVGHLVGVLAQEHYPNGDRAALRRWAPEQALPLAFYRLWLHHLHAELPSEAQAKAWMAIAWGIATCGRDGHDSKRPLGQALATSGFSEGRLERLLSAPEDVRLDLFMSAVRFLAAKGESFDWSEAARFLLTHEARKRETLSRRIADAYYRHLPKDTNP